MADDLPTPPPAPDISKLLDTLLDAAARGWGAYREVIGGLLLAHLTIERMMEALITEWFITRDDDESRRLFETAVLQRMNFAPKLAVLRALVDGDEYAKTILRQIEGANILRNKVAHRRAVFLDADERTFRFEPPDKHGAMTIVELRGHLRDMERLPGELAEAVVPLMAERSTQFRSSVQREAMRHALETYLAEQEGDIRQDGPE